MKKTLSIIFALTMIGVLAAPSLTKATTTTVSSLQELIVTLQKQIETLRAQIEVLQQAKIEVKETTKEIKGTLQLVRNLRVGMSGDDIKTLQELLASDPDIYPEGLITGYFGKLTEKAVKKFQKKACIETVGLVGPQTMRRINELLTQGAGNSGKIPKGLLTAPGIQKKLCGTTATTTPDTIAPVISGVLATSVTATTAQIQWTTDEEANSTVWYGTADPVVTATPTAQVVSSAYELSHAIPLSGLTATTTYYYVVVSTDEAGNVATATQASFTTLGE
ncbi:MAG: peptidoglycan-binding protein [Patescibacteria group bacterium]